MKYIFLGLLCCLSVQIVAQEYWEDYDWDTSPTLTTMSDSLADLEELDIIDHRAYEYYFDEAFDDAFLEVLLLHKRTRVNSDKAIERHNRVYVPTESEKSLLVAKARVINPDGSVTYIDRDDIKTATDEEDNTYSFFALEGIVEGAEVEHLLVLRRSPTLQGRELVFQGKYPTYQASFKLLAPKHLQFDFKSYNGLPEVIEDTTAEDKRVYYMPPTFVPALQDESNAAYGAHLKSIIYKIDDNLASDAYNMVTYEEITQRLFKNTQRELSRKEEKELTKLLEKEIGIKNNMTDEAKIRAIELYLKTQFLVNDRAPSVESLKDIVENRYVNESDMVHLYCALFNLQDIEYEFGLSCNRFDNAFDEEFEAYNFLQDWFFFFPELDQYLTPSESQYRLGFLPSDIMGNKGLFISKVTVGGYTTGVGKVKKIPPLPAKATNATIDITMDLSADMVNPPIRFKRTLTGYSAVGIQNFYSEMQPEEQKNLDEIFVKIPGEQAEIVDYKVENTTKEATLVKPLIFEGTIKDPSLVQKAGNKLLVKAGMLIGQQSEMYHDDERTLPVVSDFNRRYERTIRIVLPEGYTIANAEDLNINVKDANGQMAFISTYRMEDNTLVVNIEEYYRQLVIPVAQYEQYRKVINTAADFNKITLVMTPEGQ